MHSRDVVLSCHYFDVITGHLGRMHMRGRVEECITAAESVFLSYLATSGEFKIFIIHLFSYLAHRYIRILSSYMYLCRVYLNRDQVYHKQDQAKNVNKLHYILSRIQTVNDTSHHHHYLYKKDLEKLHMLELINSSL